MLLLMNNACNSSRQKITQGYVEGEYVYVGSALAGRLESLKVKRGDSIETGAVLFNLELSPELEIKTEAEHKLAEAVAKLQDLKKGLRPTEIEALTSELKQAEAAEALAEREFSRQQRLLKTSGATSQHNFDLAKSDYQQAQEKVEQIKANLQTAILGGRTDQIAAAESNVDQQKAALAKAEWEISQKTQLSPQSGIVFDTLYREGEWVPAGRPVVSLLPPENIKVRAFISEQQIGLIHPGDNIKIIVDGVQSSLNGKVSFISPRAEYTPPVIYNRESRGKLVFMIEATVDAEEAKRLHPGQPVDVQINYE